MQILRARISDLVPDPQNPRVHPRENVEAIKASLQRFGQVLPVLVRDADCRVVAGNGTIRAMQELGWEECNVALYDGDDAECRELSVRLNAAPLLARWDGANLTKALQEFEAVGVDIHTLGFDSQSLDRLAESFTNPPRMETKQATPQSRIEEDKGSGMHYTATCPQCGCRFAPASEA